MASLQTEGCPELVVIISLLPWVQEGERGRRYIGQGSSLIFAHVVSYTLLKRIDVVFVCVHEVLDECLHV